jgi:hypothetical protein
MSPSELFLARASAALSGLGLSGLATAATEPTLLVFLHVSVKQRAFQTELQRALTGIDVTAVGRVADFQRELQRHPDAVLSLPIVLSAYGLVPNIHGQRQGSSDEQYSLVGADAAPDPGRVAAVGALDLLGREGTTTFVHGLVGANPKVERVTKFEDLLPLLQMGRVDALLMPSRLFFDVKATSRMNLVERGLSNRVGLPAVASVGDGGTHVAAAVSKLPLAIAASLGVEAWR